jgi:hypothetical protein
MFACKSYKFLIYFCLSLTLFALFFFDIHIHLFDRILSQGLDSQRFDLAILGYDLILNGNEVNTQYLENMKDSFLKKCSSINLNIQYLRAVTQSLIFGTIPFIEKREAKDRVWKFIKSI